MIVAGKAGAPPRPRTNVGQAGTGGNPAEPSVRACASSERRGWFGKQLSSESQCSRSGLSHSHRAWPWAPIPARPHPTRPLPDRPRATVHIPAPTPVHHMNVEKLLPKNVLQLGLQKTAFSVLAKTQANNKTADTLFLQNQPVAARGINNKNFHDCRVKSLKSLKSGTLLRLRVSKQLKLLKAPTRPVGLRYH